MFLNAAENLFDNLDRYRLPLSIFTVKMYITFFYNELNFSFNLEPKVYLEPYQIPDIEHISEHMKHITYNNSFFVK